MTLDAPCARSARHLCTSLGRLRARTHRSREYDSYRTLWWKELGTIRNNALPSHLLAERPARALLASAIAGAVPSRGAKTDPASQGAAARVVRRSRRAIVRSRRPRPRREAVASDGRLGAVASRVSADAEETRAYKPGRGASFGAVEVSTPAGHLLVGTGCV